MFIVYLFKCEISQSLFRMKERMISHQTTLHEKEKHICQKSFGDKDVFERQQRTVNENYIPFTCDICQTCIGGNKCNL